jgi:hypothetical protein
MTEEATSLIDLFARLAHDIPDLVRKEFDCARLEISEAMASTLSALKWVALGSVIGVAAVGVLLAALVNAVGAGLLAAGVRPELAAIVAPLIVAANAGLAAGLLFWSAGRALRAAHAKLESGVSSVAASASNFAEKF